jgi:tRNA nucleotidyltransferase (CCA-adding enzyme)
MDTSIDLINRLRYQWPEGLIDFLHMAGETAASLEMDLYLVGGVVRDLLLGRPNLDFDLVTEGDATQLVKKLAGIVKGQAVIHSRFKTTTLRWERWKVDIATSRSESYSVPGALPQVSSSSIEMDLIRRDFSINAMAVCLAPGRYGKLLDLFGGRADLQAGIIRVLHDKSFQDDSSRIWRAVRYEQRLNFEIDPHTLNLICRDLSYLGSISGDRHRHELELVLKEDKPEKALRRADVLGILSYISPSLKAGTRFEKQMAVARESLKPYSVPEDLCLAFLVNDLSLEDLEGLLAYLNFSKVISRILRDSLILKTVLPALANLSLSNSAIYAYLRPYSEAAILANLFFCRSGLAKKRINLYLTKLRLIKPFLSGDDLIRMGIIKGPNVKRVLSILLEARLDEKTASREDEIEIVKKWARQHNFASPASPRKELL